MDTDPTDPTPDGDEGTNDDFGSPSGKFSDREEQRERQGGRRGEQEMLETSTSRGKGKSSSKTSHHDNQAFLPGEGEGLSSLRQQVIDNAMGMLKEAFPNFDQSLLEFGVEKGKLTAKGYIGNGKWTKAHVLFTNDGRLRKRLPDSIVNALDPSGVTNMLEKESQNKGVFEHVSKKITDRFKSLKQRSWGYKPVPGMDPDDGQQPGTSEQIVSPENMKMLTPEQIDQVKALERDGSPQSNQVLEEVNEGLDLVRANNQEIETTVERMSLRDKVKVIFKKYGLTVVGVVAAVATVLGVILSNLKAGLAKVAKGTGDALKALGKKIGEILPGMIGAIASFIFKTAGEAIGFLAKHAWLLILAVVIFFVEKLKGKGKGNKQ